ncbi:NAD-dependent protein deacetylase sirtuin-2-like isoform X2 [Accipiter gentilis]|uniref:NAD-dependent protein deacetylase sirtuin-2-like isoform X2 n=1 Tax=Astur gentilis TaxID=8957 RepID=UPI00210FEA1F|nr:NAD-dependent protein deacetylase sirtuin-2-like isoform X2 [Accipiter gentilis]
MAEPDGNGAPGARGDEAEQDAESPASDTEPSALGHSEMELLRSLLSRTLGLGKEKPEEMLDELMLEGVSQFLRSERCKNVVCMVGTGISTYEYGLGGMQGGVLAPRGGPDVLPAPVTPPQLPRSPISARLAPGSTPTCRATTCPTLRPSLTSASSSITLSPSSPWHGSSTQGSSR